VRAMPKPPGDATQPAAGMPTRGRAVRMSGNLGKQSEQASMDSKRLPASRPARDEQSTRCSSTGPERQGRSRAMARMNWSRVQRDKSLKNPPRPELDSPISAKGRHPVPAPPPPPKAAPPENAPPKDLLPAARRPKPRRGRLKTPRPGRQRTTFTCGSCRRELPISERSVGFPKRCSSCVRGVPPRQSMTNPPAAGQPSRKDQTPVAARPDDPPCPQRAPTHRAAPGTRFSSTGA
jgi:hypothetical protein